MSSGSPLLVKPLDHDLQRVNVRVSKSLDAENVTEEGGVLGEAFPGMLAEPPGPPLPVPSSQRRVPAD